MCRMSQWMELFKHSPECFWLPNQVLMSIIHMYDIWTTGFAPPPWLFANAFPQSRVPNMERIGHLWRITCHTSGIMLTYCPRCLWCPGFKDTRPLITLHICGFRIRMNLSLVIAHMSYVWIFSHIHSNVPLFFGFRYPWSLITLHTCECMHAQISLNYKSVRFNCSCLWWWWY